jgi:hypothetical protein
VLRDLTEEDLLVVGLLLVDRGAVLRVPHEEDTLASQLDVVTIGDNEFVGLLLELLGLALLVDLVRLLVVHEELGGALAAHPLVEDLLVGLLLEGLSLVLLEFEGGSYEFVHSSKSV